MIKIKGSRSNRELARQYERVGVYRLNHTDMQSLVNMIAGFYDGFPDFFPGLKAGNWHWDFDKPIEFQAIAYSDVTGWKMFFSVENETLRGCTVTLAFSGMALTPMLLVRDFETTFLKGEELIKRIDDVMPPPEPEIRKPSLWQRFKNFFRWRKRSSSSTQSSSSSVLDDIGDVVSDILD